LVVHWRLRCSTTCWMMVLLIRCDSPWQTFVCSPARAH